jgi:uncharacterized phage-associated protein
MDGGQQKIEDTLLAAMSAAIGRKQLQKLVENCDNLHLLVTGRTLMAPKARVWQDEQVLPDQLETTALVGQVLL